MKRRAIVITILGAVVALAGGYALYQLGMQRGMAAKAAPAAAVGQEKKVLYWHDPMAPGNKFDKPGKSPFMDMDLVPVYAGEAADEGKVSISPRVQQNLGIRVAEVTRGSLDTALQATGSVAFNERDVALVQARSNGFVERLYVRAPLDAVRKGQPLLELYVPDWVAAQEEYLAIKRMGDRAGGAGLLDAARQRMRLAGMSEAQIGQVQASGKVNSRMTVTAPIGGVVTELSAREGMTVASGAPLFRINGLSTVWVNAEVPEAAAGQLRPGVAVEASTPAFAEKFKGKVEAILPQVNLATRTVQARVALANPSNKLVPGMFATVSIKPAGGSPVLLAPSEAVIQTGTRSVVMLALGDGKFAPVQVETGAEVNGQTEIRKGLEAGQKVVASGQFLIDSEASLKGTLARIGEQAAAPAVPAAAPTHHASGKVEHIGPHGVTISHGPIPSLKWGPMTMEFALPAGGLPPAIKVGDTVHFEIRQVGEGGFQVVSITPEAKAPAGAHQPGAHQ